MLVSFIVSGILERLGHTKMNKQVTKNTIKKLQEETLKNILSSKGIIYQHYLRFLQRKHQSDHQYYLPTLPLK